MTRQQATAPLITSFGSYSLPLYLIKIVPKQLAASTASTLAHEPRLKYELTRFIFQDENRTKVQVYTAPLKTSTYDERHTRILNSTYISTTRLFNLYKININFNMYNITIRNDYGQSSIFSGFKYVDDTVATRYII